MLGGREGGSTPQQSQDQWQCGGGALGSQGQHGVLNSGRGACILTLGCTSLAAENLTEWVDSNEGAQWWQAWEDLRLTWGTNTWASVGGGQSGEGRHVAPSAA